MCCANNRAMQEWDNHLPQFVWLLIGIVYERMRHTYCSHIECVYFRVEALVCVRPLCSALFSLQRKWQRRDEISVEEWTNDKEGRYNDTKSLYCDIVYVSTERYNPMYWMLYYFMGSMWTISEMTMRTQMICFLLHISIIEFFLQKSFFENGF